MKIYGFLTMKQKCHCLELNLHQKKRFKNKQTKEQTNRQRIKYITSAESRQESLGSTFGA